MLIKRVISAFSVLALFFVGCTPYFFQLFVCNAYISKNSSVQDVTIEEDIHNFTDDLFDQHTYQHTSGIEARTLRMSTPDLVFVLFGGRNSTQSYLSIEFGIINRGNTDLVIDPRDAALFRLNTATAESPTPKPMGCNVYRDESEPEVLSFTGRMHTITIPPGHRCVVSLWFLDQYGKDVLLRQRFKFEGLEYCELVVELCDDESRTGFYKNLRPAARLENQTPSEQRDGK